MKIQLKKPVKHKGQELYTLEIPLEDLTGNDLIEVEELILRTGNNPVQSLDFSRVYAINVAARALHMPVEVLRQMNAHDFAKVVTEVRNFLAVSDSDEDTTESEPTPETPLATS